MNLKSVALFSIAGSLIGCAGPIYMAAPLTISSEDISTVCVVNNNDLPIEIQGQINSYIASRGYESVPISGPGVVVEMGCDV